MPVEALDWKVHDEEIARDFQRDGIVVIRGGILEPELDAFRAAFRRLITTRLTSIGSTGSQDEELDVLYNRLIACDRVYGDQIAFVGRDLPEYYRMLGHAALERCISAVLPTRQMILPYDVCLFRIDPPFDDRRNFDWHYDYPYNMLSNRAVTVWVPLTDVSEDMGSLRVVLGSHDRIWPVELRASMIGGKGTGHKAFHLANADVEDLEQRSVSLVAKAGDIALLSPFLLHRSSANRSQRARWVFNPRYCDALASEMVDRGWRSVRFTSPLLFREFHADLVRDVD